MKKFTIMILVLALVGMLFTGCGTTKKVTDDDSGDVATPALSATLDQAKITLNINVAPDNHEWITSTDTFAAVPGSLVEAYAGWPYSNDLFLGSGTVFANGTFQIDIGDKDASILAVYVVQTEQGKRKSEPIIITK